MEESLDRGRARGCCSEQIGRSFGLRDSGFVKESIDMRLAKVGVGSSKPRARSNFFGKPDT
jgi:hypothetical protein